ncbi:hypothetical protein LJC55_00745 [Eubacteriales bacterium OttesenSCG-928-N14]|nr:hypothetical protein [Eubacteriales bacterium OttesenSCG-928-N14]
MAEYKTVKVETNSGYGGPLYITPTEERPYICSCTGMVLHKVAKEIAELTGGELRDAFRNPPPYEQMACIVTDCGGTARCKIYPERGVPTICVFPVSPPSGADKDLFKPDIFITGVNKPKLVSLVEE